MYHTPHALYAALGLRGLPGRAVEAADVDRRGVGGGWRLV